MDFLNKSKQAILGLAISLLSSCATIRNGRHERIPLRSDPEGASVSIRCRKEAPAAAVTPTTITVRRGSLPCQLDLRKEGYRDQALVLQRRVSKAFWANLLWSPALSIAGFAGGQTSCEGESFFCTTRSDAARGFFILGILPAAIGMGVDAGTGAMYKSDPPSVNVTLQPR